MNTGRPFIIWTLQRTGGTNLARRLMERSGLLEAAREFATNSGPATSWLEHIDDQWKLHEPFNCGEQGRVFGAVTEQWLASHDRAALDKAVSEICALKLPMKHCVEMVPWEVSESLAAASTRHGYAHLFLYRRNSLNRLLSLHYAKISGVWGAHGKTRSELDAGIFRQPLPVDDLYEHEAHCTRRLDKAWQLLKPHGASALAFEDIYEAPNQQAAVRLIVSMLSELNLSSENIADRKFGSEIITWGDQGTKKEYGAFTGIGVLKARLGNLRPFSPGTAALEIIPKWQDIPGILHAKMDVFPEEIELGQRFEMAGVIVLKEQLLPGSTLSLVAGAKRQPVKWGISSPGMAKRFPQSANRSQARFKAMDVKPAVGAPFEIRLINENGSEAAIFSFRLIEKV